VQSHTGSIPLHQPVASKVPNSIHGPNGLLSNLGSNPPNGPQGAMQPSGAPGGLYGSQMQHGEGTPRTYMQHPAGPPGQPMMFNGSGGPIPGNVAALAQGQQPILNVRTRFSLLFFDIFFPCTSGSSTEPRHTQLALQAPFSCLNCISFGSSSY
jgi:paired amphipathic helix protein Sin3a